MSMIACLLSYGEACLLLIFCAQCAFLSSILLTRQVPLLLLVTLAMPQSLFAFALGFTLFGSMMPIVSHFAEGHGMTPRTMTQLFFLLVLSFICIASSTLMLLTRLLTLSKAYPPSD